MNRVPKLRFKEFTDEWEKKKLEDVGIIGRGKSKHRPRDDKRLYGGEYPFIQTGDIRNAGLFLDKYTQTYSEFGLAQSKLWKEGTLCITIAGNIAETSILKMRACFPDSIIGINVFNDKANNVFLKTYFDFKRKDFEKLSEGLAQSNLNLDKLKLMFFNLPNIQEQQKIADFLLNIDKKISITEEKLNLFNEYKKGIMQKIFNQELRFKDENGNDYPEWEEKKLGELLEEYNEKTTTNNQYPILSSTAGGIYLQSEYFNKQTASENNIGYKIIPKGYFTYRSMSDTGNFTFNIQERINFGIVSPAYPVFSTKLEKCNKKFLFFYLNNSDFIKEQILVLKEGGTRYALSYSKFIKLFSKLPCLEEQQKIADFLSTIDTKIEKISDELENLKEFKKGLLQQMFV